MKRLIFILFAIMLLNACTKLDEIDMPLQDETVIEDGNATEDETVPLGLPRVLHASMADEGETKDTAATRTYVENKAVLWHNQDAVSYFAADKHNVMYRFEVFSHRGCFS